MHGDEASRLASGDHAAAAGSRTGSASRPRPVCSLLTGGRVIDGLGGAPLENAVVVIRGNRIEAVGQAGAVTIPADARTIDVSGMTCCPACGNRTAISCTSARAIRTSSRPTMPRAPRKSWARWRAPRCSPASPLSATRAGRSTSSSRCAPISTPAAPSGPRLFLAGPILRQRSPDPRMPRNFKHDPDQPNLDLDAKEGSRRRRSADRARRRSDQGVRLLGPGHPARDHRHRSRRQHRRRRRRPAHHRLSHGRRSWRRSPAPRVHRRRALRLLGRGLSPAGARRAADRHRPDGEHPARPVHRADHRDAPGLRARRQLLRAARSSALRAPSFRRTSTSTCARPGAIRRRFRGASARPSASKLPSRSSPSSSSPAGASRSSPAPTPARRSTSIPQCCARSATCTKQD